MTVLSSQLEKIDEYRWRIPKSYKQGMRVDGVIYASEDMLDAILSDKALEQVANVAMLPGIVKHSLAMPDIHWGYGFPIGGVAATDVNDGGVISPGGVGFDINCLSDSFILNDLGYTRKMAEYEKDFHKSSLTCIDFSKSMPQVTKMLAFMKQRPTNTVLNVITETERQIEATKNHPFYTKDGMKEIGKLKAGDEIALYPFDGVPYEKPNHEILVDENTIKDNFARLGRPSGGNALTQILNHLDKAGILPLRYDSPQLPYLIKMLGYCMGDGLLYFAGTKKSGTTCFYGKETDLKNIKGDLEIVGLGNGAIYSRPRHHRITTSYDTIEFDCTEFWLKIASTSFALVMFALGMPIGNKCRQAYTFPWWLLKAPLWQKRLFLASFFGAEMSKPKTLTNHGYNFYCPTISMNKTLPNVGSGKEFLKEISLMLSEFGVSTHDITERREFVNKDGLISYRLRLMVSDVPENLIKLYGKIGFEYSEDRKFLANVAAGYLRLKERTFKDKEETADLAPALAASGVWDRSQIYNYLKSPYITERFINRSLYEKRKTGSRMWAGFPTFEEFLKTATEGLERSGMIWERVKSISDIEGYSDYVYDFTVAHPHHNFIANGFVVSNCGVRLVKTRLFEKDVRPKLKDLIYALHDEVPAGVGSKGDIMISAREERKLLAQGSRWVVEHGYGTPEDLDYTEERGEIKLADPDGVSPRAYERGKNQSGTLGSGNHFLEVQVIDTIYDDELTEEFGLEKNQVTLMIHSGSRGLGYQVCDEYTKDFIHALSKYGISVPDRQLACAPVNSPEGKAYLGAMRCAANYAWANRQCLMHLARGVFEKIFKMGPKDLGMDLVYDIAHNIAKIEKHNIDGKEKTLCVHRKGATRAFPPGHPELPAKYQKTGQPVIIPGDMGRSSYLLVGTEGAKETFYSTCHGAGRLMSRSAAIRNSRGRSISRELENKGIIVKSSGRETLAEEMPEAYKDVNQVVNVVHGAGISKRVCRMRPIGVIKG